MSDVPNDSWLEILRRVPVDTLFRFRSVCRSWRSIIDDPKFVKLHISGGLGDGWMLHKRNTGMLFLLPVSHLSLSNPVEMVDAIQWKPPVGMGKRQLPVPNCNGLVLISNFKKNFHWVMWNPFTGESLKLPLCDEFLDYEYEDTPVSGLGYDEAINDYKVVQITQNKTFICSENSGSWRRIQDFPNDFYLARQTYDGVFASGSLYWVAGSGSLFDLQCIFALNLTTETCRKITLPSEIKAGRLNHFTLVASSGCLFLYSHLCGLKIWMMKDYHCCDENMWIKIISFNECCRPIAYRKKENQFLLRYDNEMFAWFDMEKKSSRKVFMKVNPDYKGGDFSSQVIPASLVRIKRSDDANEGVTSEGTSSKRKRKRADVGKLGLKVSDGSSDD